MIYSRKAREELKKEAGSTQRGQERAAGPILEGSEGRPRIRAMPQARSTNIPAPNRSTESCRSRQFHPPPPNEIQAKYQAVVIQI